MTAADTERRAAAEPRRLADRGSALPALRYIVGEIDAALSGPVATDADELRRLLHYIRWQIAGDNTSTEESGL